MDIEKEKSAFLDIYKYYPSAIKFTFDVENECFVLSKKNPLDHEVEVMSQMNQQWQAWFRRAKLEYEKPDCCAVVPIEPTDAMLFAASGRDIVAEHYGDENILWPELRETWKAMVEAARGGNE